MKRRLRLSAAMALVAPLATLGVSSASAEPSPDATAPQPVLVGHAPLELRAVLPVSGYRLTGRYGDSAGPWSHGHTGLDFAVAYGRTIRSITSGVVTSVEYDGAFGLKTVITTDDGEELWFCHQSDTNVEVGERVAAGEPIGAVGTTGNTTGPHLHLEVHAPHETDPYAWLRERGVKP